MANIPTPWLEQANIEFATRHLTGDVRRKLAGVPQTCDASECVPIGEFVFVNPEAATLVAAMTVEPNNARKQLIDNLVGSLKSANVWTALDVLQVYTSHDVQAALLNWKNPGTFNATLVQPTTAVAFTVDSGFITNGTDNYVDTGFNPATAGGSFAQDSACFGVWFGNDKGGGYGVTPVGWEDGTDGIAIHPRNANNQMQVRINQANNDLTTIGDVTSSIGLSVGNRSGAGAVEIYKNGVALTLSSIAEISTPLNSNNLFIGRSATAAFNIVDARACYMGGNINAAGHSAIFSAINAYMTAA